MKKIVTLFFFMPVACLASCKKHNYESIINQYLNDEVLCVGVTNFPITIYNGKDQWISLKMNALADSNLVKTIKGKQTTTWKLTKYGAKHFSKLNGFCYGPMKVYKIDSVKNIRENIVSVTYRYKIIRVPDWAINPSIRFAFTDLDNNLQGNKQSKFVIQLKKNTDDSFKIHQEPVQIDLLY